MSEIEVFNQKELEEVRKAITEISDIYQDHKYFWSNAGGWAPDNADKILSRSRLDWLHALSESLLTWTEVYRTSTDNEGKLILAWVNLGALFEGGLKLFLSVFVNDYLNSPNVYRDRNNQAIEPDVLSLEQLKVLLQKDSVFEKKWITFISLVQQRRNAIHAYKDRDIGNWKEFYESIKLLCEFTVLIKEQLPYPG